MTSQWVIRNSLSHAAHRGTESEPRERSSGGQLTAHVDDAGSRPQAYTDMPPIDQASPIILSCLSQQFEMALAAQEFDA